jgi:hypothetical protein
MAEGDVGIKMTSWFVREDRKPYGEPVSVMSIVSVSGSRDWALSVRSTAPLATYQAVFRPAPRISLLQVEVDLPPNLLLRLRRYETNASEKHSKPSPITA